MKANHLWSMTPIQQKLRACVENDRFPFSEHRSLVTRLSVSDWSIGQSKGWSQLSRSSYAVTTTALKSQNQTSRSGRVASPMSPTLHRPSKPPLVHLDWLYFVHIASELRYYARL